MKLNKIIILISMLIIVCLVSNSYAENVTYSNETTNITFEGVNFTIPEGFGQLKDDEDFNDLGSDGKTCFYINEAKGEIQITVISDWMGMNLDELYKDGATKTKVNGHHGWNYTQDGLHYFGYVHNDTGILVGVTNETRLFEVIL
jgi:hypothetical protein